MARTEIEPFQAQLFQALSGETRFEDVIKALADDAGAASGVLFTLNRKTGEILDWASPELKFGDDAYSEHINSINPRMRYSMAHAPGHVTHEARFISEKAMASNEFYDWLDREFGLKNFLGIRLFDEGDLSVFHSVEFSKHSAAPDREDVTAFARKSQALANAWKISKRIRPSETAMSAADFTPDFLPWAVFAVSSGGIVLSMNSRATKEVTSGEVVALDPHLSSRRKSERSALHGAVQRAIKGERCEILLTGSLSSARFLVQCVPVSGHHDVAALVYLWNPNHRSENIKLVLMSLWKLTRQEAELVLVITSGSSLGDASEALGITRNTGRNHLNSVFAKMGINSQIELMTRIFGVLS